MYDYNPCDTKSLDKLTKEQNEKLKLEQIAKSKKFVSTFSTDDGKWVLDYFKKNTLDCPSWMMGWPENHAVYREGQNSIIREIISTMKTEE